MKKFLLVINALILVLAMTACTDLKNSNKITLDTISEPLVVGTDNSLNNSIYLTERKFIFTSFDKNGEYGDCNTAYIRDLITGKTEKLLPFSAGDVKNMIRIDDTLYFTCYCRTDYSDEAPHGFCLYSYNLENGYIKSLYKTPNTVGSIYVTETDGKLLYSCSNDEQNSEYTKKSIHLYDPKIDTDTVIMKDLMVTGEYIFSYDNKAYLTYYENGVEKLYTINSNGEITEKSVDEIPEQNYERDTVNGKEVCAKFGDYMVLEDDAPKSELDPISTPNDCGCKYNQTYYLVKSDDEKNMLKIAKATYWHYHC